MSNCDTGAQEEEKSKDQENLGNSSRNILSLPHLVIHEILKRLNLRVLKKLRLVSKQTKEWVEQPEYLQEFKIRITSDKLLKQVVHSTVRWNNLSFLIPGWYVHERLLESKNFYLFVNVKHLEIRNDLSHEMTVKIFQNINLTIETLTLNSFTAGDSTVGIRKFVNLKKLLLDRIQMTASVLAHEVDKKKQHLFDFETILSSCPNLTYLRLPTTTREYRESESEHEDTKESDFRKFILDPLLKYLARFESKSSPGLLIDLSGYTYHKIPITSDGLLELAHVCHRMGARLCNVLVHALRNNVTKTTKTFVDKSVISVKALNEGLKDIYIPPSSQVHVIIGFYSPETHNLLKFSAPIHSLYIQNCFHFPIGEPLLQELFGVTRPTVQEFIYLGHKWDAPTDNSFAVRICNSFPNLTKLELTMCGCDIDYITFLRRLPLLSHLSLMDCVCLTDEGLLGTDVQNPVILQLTNLVALEMSRTNITDLCFTNAFRHMKLKTFKWIFQSSAQVTFGEGISSLATVEGGFKDTIETLEISLPSDSPKGGMMVDWADRFKNLNSFKTSKI